MTSAHIDYVFLNYDGFRVPDGMWTTVEWARAMLRSTPGCCYPGEARSNAVRVLNEVRSRFAVSAEEIGRAHV